MEAVQEQASSTEAEVRRLRQLQRQGRHGEALEGARALLVSLPQNRDLLLIEAMSLRHLARIGEALAVLDRLEQLQPRFSQLHQERGLCHVARKEAPQAIEALLRAVNITRPCR
jgi:tetratricopeptide (TPR) repeat protein